MWKNTAPILITVISSQWTHGGFCASCPSLSRSRFEYMSRQPDNPVVAVFDSTRTNQGPQRVRQKLGELLSRSQLQRHHRRQQQRHYECHPPTGAPLWPRANPSRPMSSRWSSTNQFQTDSPVVSLLFVRKVCALKYATAVIAFPGGFGCDELSVLLTSADLKINRIRLFLSAKEFWSGGWSSGFKTKW